MKDCTPQPRGVHEVARIFHRRAITAELDDAATISGRSARVGAANVLMNNGETTAQISHAGGWPSAEMVKRHMRRHQVAVNAVASLRERTAQPAFLAY